MAMCKIVLVGEAWGRKEELFAHAFVGSSGAELARMLHQAGLTPGLPTKYPSELDMIRHWKRVKEECDISLVNVFNLHPESNNIALCFTSAKEGITSIPPLKAGKYLRPDLLHHVEKLWADIENAKPNLIIALGDTACWAVLGEGKITAVRGTVKMSPRLKCKVLPTFHPASIMYEGQWRNRPIVVSDLEKAKREAEFPEVRRIERWLTVEPTLDKIAEWIERPAEYYAVDIETGIEVDGTRYLSNQISMIGFARSANDALVIPFIDGRKDGWNYWPTVEGEIQARRLAQRALSRPVPKIFQNGVFDLSHLLREDYRPTMCEEDTMLLHHSLYPEMLKGLGFLGSVYSEEIAWKQMKTKGDNLKRDE